MSMSLDESIDQRHVGRRWGGRWEVAYLTVVEDKTAIKTRVMLT